MSYGNFVRAFKEFGAVGTFKKLYQQRTLKFGSLVGTDRYGNKYFENTEDYHHGKFILSPWLLFSHRVCDCCPMRLAVHVVANSVVCRPAQMGGICRQSQFLRGRSLYSPS